MMLQRYLRILLLLLMPAAAFAEESSVAISPGSSLGFTSSENSYASEKGTPANDPTLDRRWAQGHGWQETRETIQKKITAIFNSADISDSAFANFYADVSSLLAKTLPNARCFDGDKTATVADADTQREWASSHSREEALDKLIAKTNTMFKCLTHDARVEFYSSISPLLSIAPISPDDTQTRASLRTSVAKLSVPITAPVAAPEVALPAALDTHQNKHTNKDQENTRGFRVWLKVSGCSEDRDSWITVSSKDPSTQSAKFEEANVFYPSVVCSKEPYGCNESQASIEAELLKSTPEFPDYCCHQ